MMWGSSDDGNPIGRVLPDFTVEIDTERLSSSRLATLRQFAEPVSCIGRQGIFRLSADSVARGRALGVSSREILFLLRHIHGRSLPESVASTVSEWAESFGQGALEKAVWLRGEPELLTRASQALEGLEPVAQGDETDIYLSRSEADPLARALAGQGIFASVRPLEPKFRGYAPAARKENGIFNHSLRAAYELYCLLRDGQLATISDPVAALYRRFGLKLGALGRTAKQTKEQRAALRTLADQRLWDVQVKLVGLYLAEQEYSEIGGFDPLVSDQIVRELDHLRHAQQVRQKLGDYLCESNPLEWTPLLPFVRRLRKESPKVIRATRSWDWSYLRRQDRPWEEVEDYWLMHLLTHEFWWLGIVELYWTKAYGPTAFRLTADGLSLLTGQEPVTRKTIVTAPTGWTVLEPRMMRVEELGLLMQFVVDQPLTCQWSVYWDRHSLYDAVIRGISLAKFEQLLTNYCPDIPTEMSDLITELKRHGERMTIHEGYLLTCQEPVLLESLLAVKSLALCIQERLAPTAAVVYPAAVNRLLRGSERSGISIADRTAVTPSHQASARRGL